MAIFENKDATLKAIGLAELAIEKGLLAGVTPNGFNNPVESGKKTAEFVGSFIKELTKQLESL